MARFVSHEPCPRCGSRDNLGRYDDGSAFCFGCKYTERAKHAPRNYVKKEEVSDNSIPLLPDDTGTTFSPEAVQWMAQYHLSVEEAISHGVRWSDSRQQLIFLLEDGCWQARNFLKSRSKYFTAGDVNGSIKVYLQRSESSRHQQLAVVEDCVSAIRIAISGTNAMPVLGSHVSIQKLTRLSRIYGNLVFWLDHDKLKEARKMADQAKMLGLSTSVLFTELDPKCYTDEEISVRLKQ